MHSLFEITLVVLAVYGALILYLAVRQARYIYHPNKLVGLTPAYFKLDYTDLRLNTEDGETIAAWFVPGRSTGPLRYTLILCHGNAGNRGDCLDSIRAFSDMGFDVLIFDYRGYGESTGEPSETGTYRDAMAVWKYLTGERGIVPQKIVIFGRSLGGAVAVWLGCEVGEAAAVAVESTFTSAADMAAEMFPFLPSRWICRFHYNTISRIGRLRSPVLISHSRHDEMIPFRHGQELFQAAAEPKRFIERKGSHNEGGIDVDPQHQSLWLDFLGNFTKVGDI